PAIESVEPPPAFPAPPPALPEPPPVLPPSPPWLCTHCPATQVPTGQCAATQGSSTQAPWRQTWPLPQPLPAQRSAVQAPSLHTWPAAHEGEQSPTQNPSAEQTVPAGHCT